jgi:hypothetical protein
VAAPQVNPCGNSAGEPVVVIGLSFGASPGCTQPS